MTTQPSGSTEAGSTADEPWAERIRALERIVVRCEGQIEGLQQRVAELELARRVGRRRALWLRLALLVLLLSAYVVLRGRYAG